jgi:hypothetical protein
VALVGGVGSGACGFGLRNRTSGGLGRHRPAQLCGSVRQRAGGADESRGEKPCGIRELSECGSFRLQKAVSRSKENASGAPKGAPVRVMGRQFPPAGGTGPAVRRANGCGVPRPRISALRFPLSGVRRVRNRQFGTTVRRDAPRGNAPARFNTWIEKGMRISKFVQMTLDRHARARPGHPLGEVASIALRKTRFVGRPHGWPGHRRAKRRRPSDGYARP